MTQNLTQIVINDAKTTVHAAVATDIGQIQDTGKMTMTTTTMIFMMIMMSMTMFNLNVQYQTNLGNYVSLSVHFVRFPCSA
jgi:uncharacterized membrane protein YesL